MMFGLESITRIFAVEIPKIELSLRELIYAEIQITGGAVLAVHTYEKGTGGILPFMFSAIALGGTYNFFKIIRRATSSTETPRNCSAWNFARGTFTFSTGLFAFSEFLKRTDVMWIPCLVLAASGYYFATSSIYRLDTVLSIGPWRKCCQLMSEPALVACAATYLFYCRNHTEEWLKILPFLVTAVTGLKIANRGSLGRMNMYNNKLLLPKAIELMMGSCFLCISCTALTIYCSVKDFYWPWTAFMSFWSLHGLFLFFASLACFQGCIEMKAPVFYRICGMVGGPIVSLSVAIGNKFIRHPIIKRLLLVTFGSGYALFGKSVIDLVGLVPAPIFLIYYQRVMGPLVTVNVSTVAAYLGYYEGWRFSLLTIPVLAAGIYATYDGFRKPIDDNDIAI